MNVVLTSDVVWWQWCGCCLDAVWMGCEAGVKLEKNLSLLGRNLGFVGRKIKYDFVVQMSSPSGCEEVE